MISSLRGMWIGKAQGSRFKVCDVRCKVYGMGLGFRVQSSGFRVYGIRFRVKDDVHRTHRM